MYRPPIRLSSPSVRFLAMGLDMLIICISGFVACLWYLPPLEAHDIPPGYKMLVLAAAFLFLVSSPSLYRSWRVNELGAMLRSVAVAWMVTIMILLAGLFVTKASSDFSRVWFGAWSVGTLGLLMLQRLVVYAGLRWLRDKGYNYKRVLVVGDSPSIQHVEEALEQAAWSGLRLLGKVMPSELDAYIQKQHGLKTGIDEVWLCLRRNDDTGIRLVLDALRHSTANIRLVPDWFTLKLLNHGVSEVVGIQMLDLSASPITGELRLIKAVQDFVLASLILLLISPLLVAIALAVKFTSRGPVLYQQKRHGWNGEEIWVYKFRSMVVHHEAGSQVTQASKHDSRITPLGAFLRRTSLDELPQFINVLQGRMSIVGPRPHAMAHNEHYKELVPGYALRHKVKPGITGWAQVNGFRGETDTLDKMAKRVEYDLYYIEHVSLWLDLKIIVATVFKGFVHKNAY
ncbi:undecaprenyl-phosphate glucose phosphotransferase [Polaromonas naphthalenivorans]|uniref:Sugar transferase n=1 Tax=Polaromonas naphthalenivorans (strain CJ2) TaxID=365044 RepID=A1VS46_POLNA|nr:undecaprenyl-phosphate glucose phosphotransferase [Polaromonas naphthalenivorans]ABM38474.1 sugar transferase [Polaromonas naphthalenivorans CJ2]